MIWKGVSTKWIRSSSLFFVKHRIHQNILFEAIFFTTRLEFLPVTSISIPKRTNFSSKELSENLPPKPPESKKDRLPSTIVLYRKLDNFRFPQNGDNEWKICWIERSKKTNNIEMDRNARILRKRDVSDYSNPLAPTCKQVQSDEPYTYTILNDFKGSQRSWILITSRPPRFLIWYFENTLWTLL